MTTAVYEPRTLADCEWVSKECDIEVVDVANAFGVHFHGEEESVDPKYLVDDFVALTIGFGKSVPGSICQESILRRMIGIADSFDKACVCLSHVQDFTGATLLEEALYKSASLANNAQIKDLWKGVIASGIKPSEYLLSKYLSCASVDDRWNVYGIVKIHHNLAKIVLAKILGGPRTLVDIELVAKCAKGFDRCLYNEAIRQIIKHHMSM